MEDDLNATTASNLEQGKIIYIGNLKQTTQKKWLEDFLHRTTEGFVRITSLQYGSKKTKFAIACFRSHVAAAKAILTLKNEPLGPQNTTIVVDFKKKKCSQNTTEKKLESRSEQSRGDSPSYLPTSATISVRKQTTVQTTKETARTSGAQCTEEGQKKIINDSSFTAGKNVKKRPKFDIEQVSKIPEALPQPFTEVNKEHLDKIRSKCISDCNFIEKGSANNHEREACNTNDSGNHREKQSERKIKQENTISGQYEPLIQPTHKSSVEQLPSNQLFSPNEALNKFPALRRFNQRPTHPITPPTARVSSENMITSSVQSSCVLFIKGTDGEEVDKERLFEFCRRTLPSEYSLKYENEGTVATITFTHNVYAELAYNILANRPLSSMGGPVKVDYSRSSSENNDYSSDSESVIKSDTIVDMPTSQRTHKSTGFVEQLKILRVSSENENIKISDFERLLRDRNIKYEKCDVHHPKGKYGTLARIEFRSHEETLEAERKISDCVIGEPAGVIHTVITSRRHKNRRRKIRHNKVTSSNMNGSAANECKPISLDQTNVSHQLHDEGAELEIREHDDSCIEESEVEPLSAENTYTSVLVRNIDKSITESHIRIFLSENDIDTSGFQFFKSLGNRGSYAIVQFQYPEEAHEALRVLKEQPLEVLGNKIQVTFNKKSPRGTPNPANASQIAEGKQQKGNRKPNVNSDKDIKKQTSKLHSPNDVIICDLPNNVSESDIAELVWKCSGEVRSGFINCRMTDTEAILDFKTQASAITAVAQLHFIRVKGHTLKARLAIQNHDFDLLLLRKQREVLITHIKDTEKSIYLEMETKMNQLAVEIAEVENDLILCDSFQQGEAFQGTKDKLQHNLDEMQGFCDEFEQTVEEIRQHLHSLISETTNVNQCTLAKLDELCKRIEREKRRTQNPLPIYGYKSKIVQVVTDPSTQACVIQAETGSGKSTQVPQYLIESILQRNDFGDAKCGIICTQPRRIAAVTLAKRVADEYGCKIGHEVGFIAGNRKEVSLQTLVTFMTDRALLNCCLADSHYLRNYRYVIIDEAHERSVDTDILIAMLKKELAHQRNIKIVIMSATIDVDLFASYYNGCPVVDIPGRIFPVEVEWCMEAVEGNTTETDDYVNKAVKKCYDLHRNEDIPGDILVFLTSQNEINRACNDLKCRLGVNGIADADENVNILPLHGKLQSEDQFKVFRKTREGCRKIVFATNIAETSVTIPGVKYVVDTGMMKELQYDPLSNMSLLKVTSITQASAEQRKGRSGRTGPGKCFRLYSKTEYNDMDQCMKPEILKVHLGMAVIQILLMGVRDIEHFDFVESPEPEAIQQAIKSLILLGAINDTDKSLTNVGYQMAKLPLEPRLAKLILEGAKRNVLGDAIVMAALISAPGNIYYRGSSDTERKTADHLKLRFCVEDGDVITMLAIYKEWHAKKNDSARNRWCKENSFNAKTLRTVQQSIEDLNMIIKQSKVSLTNDQNSKNSPQGTKHDQLIKTEKCIENTKDIALRSVDRIEQTRRDTNVTNKVTEARLLCNSNKKRIHKDLLIPVDQCNDCTDVTDSITVAKQVQHFGTEIAKIPQKCDRNKILRKILMAAYFENLSVFSGHIRIGYTIASLLKTAVFHPSSALAALNSRPEWVIYGELRSTSRDFLCIVTPVDISWIDEVVPAEFNQHVDLTKLKECVMTEATVNDVGTAIMKIVSKRRFEHVSNLEGNISKKADAPCIIRVDVVNGSLTVCIATHSKTIATEMVKKSLDDIKTQLRIEQMELPIGQYGRVRHVVVSGGQTRFVLTEEEYRSVELISEDLSEEVMHRCLQKVGFGKEDVLDLFRFPKHFYVAKQCKWGKVTLSSPGKARQLVEHDLIETYGVSVQPVLQDNRFKFGKRGSHMSASINTNIKVSWFTELSKGHGSFECERPSDVPKVILKLNFTRIRNQEIQCKRVIARQTSVFVCGLDADVTSEELEEHIKKRTTVSIQPKSVFVLRHKTTSKTSDAAYKAELRRIFRDVSDQVEVNVRPARSNAQTKRKAYISLEPNLGIAKRRQLKKVMKMKLPNMTTLLNSCTMEARISCGTYCSQQVYRSVKDDLSHELRGTECKVNIESTNKIPPDERINISGDQFDQVEDLAKKLQAILHGEQIHVNTLVTGEFSYPWIDKVLTRLTETHLKDILKKTKAHADVDIRRQTIKLYGTKRDRLSLKSDLSKYFTSAAHTMFREVDIAGLSYGQTGLAMRTLVREYGPWLGKLKHSSGVDDITIDLKCGILFVGGSEESFNNLISRVNDSLKRVTNSSAEDKMESEPGECGACLCTPSEAGTKPYRLASCGHFFCQNCLNHHLKQSAISKKFPITCPGCEENIMLCDIKFICPDEDERQRIYRAGLDSYVSQNHEGDIRFCPGADCCMVYRKYKDGGNCECNECGHCFCTACGNQSHPDNMSCKEFQISQTEFSDIEMWLKESGVDAKKCPSCFTLIEKSYGSNHMVCLMCKKHICWICLKFYDNESRCHSHLIKRHGGIFGVAVDPPRPNRANPQRILPRPVERTIHPAAPARANIDQRRQYYRIMDQAATAGLNINHDVVDVAVDPPRPNRANPQRILPRPVERTIHPAAPARANIDQRRQYYRIMDQAATAGLNINHDVVDVAVDPPRPNRANPQRILPRPVELPVHPAAPARANIDRGPHVGATDSVSPKRTYSQTFETATVGGSNIDREASVRRHVDDNTQVTQPGCKKEEPAGKKCIIL